jgi:hypothetical protein
MKILVEVFNTKVRKEDTSKPQSGMRVYMKLVTIIGLE